MEVSQKTLKRFTWPILKKYIYNNFLQKKEFCKKKNEIFKILQSNYLVFSIFTKRKYLRNFKVDLIRTMLTLELS